MSSARKFSGGYSGGGYSGGGYSGGGARNSNRIMNKKDVPLPPHFQCRICEKVKSVNLFSKKEQMVYQTKVFSGGQPGPLHYHLCCRGCNGAPSMEMFCKGQCSMWKSLDDFSKTQRLNADTAVCLICMDWKLAAEPGLPVQPVSHGIVAAETGPKEVISGNWEESDEDDDGLPGYVPTVKSTKKGQTLSSIPATSAQAITAAVQEGNLIDVSDGTTTVTDENTLPTAERSTPATSGHAGVFGARGTWANIAGNGGAASGSSGQVANRSNNPYWPKLGPKPVVPRQRQPLVPSGPYFPPTEDEVER